MWFLPISMLVFSAILAIPMSRYLAWIMDGKYQPPQIFAWFERTLDSGPQNWKQYTISLLIFNTALFVFGFIVSRCSPGRRLIRTARACWRRARFFIP